MQTEQPSSRRGSSAYAGDGAAPGYVPEKRGTGMIVMSGILLILGGLSLLHAAAWSFNANTAIQNSVNAKLLFGDKNLDTWGWVYGISGAVVVLAGICVFFRARWAVWVGILAAMTSIIVQFFWLFSPYWASALVTIGLGVLVLYSLAMYGRPGDYADY